MLFGGTTTAAAAAPTAPGRQQPLHVRRAHVRLQRHLRVRADEAARAAVPARALRVEEPHHARHRVCHVDS